MDISPRELKGEWDEGYAFDLHTTSSTSYIDEYGQIQYENQYSKLGLALNRFKYHNDYSQLTNIIEKCIPFIDIWHSLKLVDLVIPVPPSDKGRLYQPAFEIGKEVAKYLKTLYSDEVLINTSHTEAKHETKPQGSIEINKRPKYKYNILLVDDLYNTGNTLKECVKVINENNLAYQIFVMTITKTRKGGLR